MQWYCYIGGQQYGPVVEEVLRDWARAGRLTPNDKVWAEGMPNWAPAASVPGLFGPGVARPAYARPHRGATVLVLGILGLVIGCGPGLILGPIAWVMGRNDLRDMVAGRMDRTGQGMTRAGVICGIVAIGLNIVGLVLGILWLAMVLQLQSF